MKKTITTICMLASMVLSNAQNTFPATGSAGIGTSAPAASSLLEVKSTTKGVLIPRMTQTQRNAIASPATGLLIYQTTNTQGFYYYTGTAWTAIKNTAGWGLKGNAGTSPGTNFIGTTDAQPLLFKVNNQLSGKLDFNSSANTSYGYQTLLSNTGTNNTAMGYESMSLNTTGGNNTAMGANCLLNNTTGYQNTAVGSNALISNQTGNENSALGYGTLLNNTTGGGNIAIGNVSLYHNTSGNENTAMGVYTLYNNTTGGGSVAYGAYALQSNTTGTNNTAIGNSALYSNANGSENVAVGIGALSSNTSGSWNVATGNSAMFNNTSGFANTAYGFHALLSLTTGYWNTCIGNMADVSLNYLGAASAIGVHAIANADNKIVIGESGVASMVIGGYKAWSNLSDGRFKEQVKENVPGLEFINQLRPVTYTVDVNTLQHHITAQMPDSIASHYYPTEDAIAAAKKTIQTGFIAQEVETTAKSIGYQFDGVNAPQNPTDNYSIAYSQFVPSLVKAVQQLDKENAELKKQMQQMQDCINSLCENSQKSNGSLIQNTPSIQIAPNPANRIVRLSISGNDTMQNLTIKILDSSGKLIRSFIVETEATTIEFNTSSLSKGTYTVQLLNQMELLKSEKLVVQ